MKDLGYTPPKKERDEMKAVCQPEQNDEPQYPSLRFNGEQAEKAGLHECRFGDEYTINIRVKAVSIDGSMGFPGSGTSRENPLFQFDVLACDTIKPENTEADDTEDEYEPPKSKIELGPPERMKRK